MEYKIGQVFEFRGKWYQFVEVNGPCCNNCVFNQGLKCIHSPEPLQCARFFRTDGKNGHVVLLDAIGGEYKQGNAIFRDYRCQTKPVTTDKRVYISNSDSEVGLIVSIRLTSSSDMERKIGEIFEYNGEWYQCVESDSCGECSLFTTECGSGTKSDLADKVFGQCSRVRRSDNKHAIFKKLEKVGEPFKIVGKLYQYYKVFDIDNVCGDGPWCVYNYKAKTLTIEIKENKEDMEENKTTFPKEDNALTRTVYAYVSGEISDKELIRSIKEMSDEYPYNKNNLKPFSLELAKQGKPVCTRDGVKARIICFDAKSDAPIIALITTDDGTEIAFDYLSDGTFFNRENPDNDLMMLPEKKEGWVNVSKFSIYASKEEALSHKTYDIISTVKVEWYE